MRPSVPAFSRPQEPHVTHGFLGAQRSSRYNTIMKSAVAPMPVALGFVVLAVVACSGTTTSGTADAGSDAGAEAGGASACIEGGKTYASGDTVPSRDGCNRCTCTNGRVACTEMACSDTGCNYDGRSYFVGDNFPATDGCNTCTCTDSGVACSKKACLADAGSDTGADAGDGGYSCPKDGTYNCQPPVAPPNQVVCAQPYRAWVQANCPGVSYVD